MSRLGQQDVGHEGVITGRDALSLRSSMCSLQGLICDATPRSHPVSTPINLYMASVLSNVIHYFCR
ncbi:hypothetical protein [Lysinibacillus xylanilyticus]|uniref:hypothetical protein n=1 Tax=Lysinibacillus xylanilyticus TaxID=582475 RepID=UPI003830CE31